jgi:putative phage-type endonuclease
MLTLQEFYGMQGHPGIEFIGYDSDKDWLEKRKEGIGGSDAAAVLGMSKYTSPLKVYRLKLGEVKEDLSENVYVKKGKDLEALIRDVYVIPHFQELGYSVRHPEHMFISYKTPWLRANCDGIAVPNVFAEQHYSKNIVVEIKWVSEWGEANWYGDEYYGVPAEYYAQVQHYMLVTGARKAVICALFDKAWEMHYFEIPFDAAFANKLEKETYKFYTYNLQMHIPPKVDIALDKAEALSILKEEPATVVKNDPVFETLIAEYLVQKASADEHTKHANTLMKTISEMYLEGHRSDTFKMSISKCTRTSFNTSKFEEEYPELYKQFLQTSEFTRTVVKRK